MFTKTTETPKKQSSKVQYKIVTFYNNYLLGLSENNPEKYLNSIEKDWLKTLQKDYQNTVKIYKNSEYLSKINSDFDKLGGNFPLEEFFEQTPPDGQKKPKLIMKEKNYKILKERNVFAPDSKEPNTHNARQYTKYRVICSEVPFLNSDNTLGSRKIITACAPNLMNSSPKDMEKYLLDPKATNKSLNEEAYKKACNELAHLIVYAAKDYGMPELDIAEFGLGVYLRVFKDDFEKEKARTCMYKAFAEAAELYNFPINWIIYEGHDAQSQKQAKASVDYLNGFCFKKLTFKTGNILDSKYSLNNGSDRTIGGKHNAICPTPTEEQLTQIALLPLVQSSLNPNYNNTINSVEITKNRVLFNFIKKHRLDLSIPENREYWQDSIGIEIEIENQSYVFPMPIIIIWETFMDSKLSSSEKLQDIYDNCSKYNQRNSSFFVDKTETLIADIQNFKSMEPKNENDLTL